MPEHKEARARRAARVLFAALTGIACSAAALAAPTAAAAATGSAAEARGDEHGVLRATLANGLRVVIVRNTLAPVVSTSVNYLVGSDEAPAGFPGTAHAQEHMMFRGSPGLTADQLADIGSVMGGDFNANTREGLTQYLFTVPADDLDVALHIEAMRMRAVLDTPRGLGSGARRDRAGSRAGSVRALLHALRRSCARACSPARLRARCARHAALLRQDHRRHAEELPRHLVRAQQCHPGHRRRRRAGRRP